MKINHSDDGPSHKFHWTCISCTSGSHENSGSRNNELFPRNRFLHAACVQGHYLYVLGGKDRYSPLKDMWRLDTVTGTWKQIRDVATKIPHLQGHTVLSYKSQLLIFGGTFYDTDEDTPLWIYNTDLNHVHKYCHEAGSLSPVGRREHSAVIYKNSMYIYGGFLDNSGSTEEFWAFRIQEEEWRIIRRHKPGKRHGHIAVVMGNSMWLHGGMKGLTALSDLWTFNFAMCTWNKVKGLGTCPALSNHSAHVVDDSLLLFGGSKCGAPSQDIWSFKFSTSTWRQISLHKGDKYPPITLHSSIVLRSSVVQDVGSDHARSVPQLKVKNCSLDQDTVRPWTSCAGGQQETKLSPRSSGFTSHTVDILRLETLGTNLDGNNNKSDESLNFDSSRTRLEEETSFSSAAHTRFTINQPKDSEYGKEYMIIKHTDAESNVQHFTSPSNLAKNQQVSTARRIHAGSAEHCNDDLPLLQRFQSVTSDVDLGENNLTLTLSDEDICRPDLPQICSKTQLGNLTSFHNQVFTDDNRDVFFSETVVSKVMTGDNSAVDDVQPKDSSIEMQVFRDSQSYIQSGTGETVESSHLQHEHNKQEQIRTAASTGSIQTFPYTGRTEDVNFVNPMYEKLFHMDESVKMPNAVPVGTLTYQTHNSQPLEETSMRAFLPLAKQENVQPSSSCLNDLIVEDLETCDIGQLFQHTKLACPSTNSLRWSSVKDLHVTDHESSEDLSCQPSPEKHRWHTRSCGNLISSQSSESLDKDTHLQGVRSKAKKNSLDDMYAAAERSKHGELVGKFVKHARPTAGRSMSHLHKSKNNLYKSYDGDTSNKFSVVTTHSISTQTTSSQTSLQASVSGLSSFQAEPKYDHFITMNNLEISSRENQPAILARGQQWPQNSILGDSELCILIIGGQIENASLQTEPLKMWRCHLY